MNIHLSFTKISFIANYYFLCGNECHSSNPWPW